MQVNLIEYFPEVKKYYWSLSEEEEQSIKKELKNAEVEINEFWMDFLNLDSWYSFVLDSYWILYDLVKSWKITKEDLR